MVTAKRGDRKITRNAAWFKVVDKIQHQISENDEDDDDISIIGGNTNYNGGNVDIHEDVENEVVLRRSNRATGMPVRYPMDVRQ